MGANLFHVDRWMDGQTDRHDKTNSNFCNFVNAPKKVTIILFVYRE